MMTDKHLHYFLSLVGILIVLASCSDIPLPLPVEDERGQHNIIYLPYLDSDKPAPRQGVAGGNRWYCQSNVEFETRWNDTVVNKSCNTGTGVDYFRIPLPQIKIPNGGDSIYYTPEKTAQILREYDDLDYVPYVLFFNECEYDGQCDMHPYESAQEYHEILEHYVALGGTLDTAWGKYLIGGFNIQQCGLDWITMFLQYWRRTYNEEAPRVGFHVHLYPDIEPLVERDCPEIDRRWRWAFDRADTPQELFSHWKAQVNYGIPYLQNLSFAYDKIVVSEMGCLMVANSYNPGCSEWEFTTEYLQLILDELNNPNSTAFMIEMYAYYTDSQGSYSPDHQQMWYDDGGLTPLGVVYTNYTPLHYYDLVLVP